MTTKRLQELVAPLPLSDVQEVCACYFETHVSPMLKIIQDSQELMNEKLEDNHTSVQEAVDALRMEQRLLQDRVAKSPDDHKVAMLGRMQELTAKVHQKADASDVARLSAQVESGLSSRWAITWPQMSPQVNSPSHTQREDRVDAFEKRLDSSLQECMARFNKLDSALAKKADSDQVAALVQLQEVRVELLSATAVKAEHWVEPSTSWTNMEGNKLEAWEEQAEPSRQDVSNSCVSQMLKSRLTNAKEDNEPLQLQHDAAMKQVERVSSAKAVDFEPPLPPVTDATILQISQSEPEPVRSRSSQGAGKMEISSTQLQNNMKSGPHPQMREQTKAEAAVCTPTLATRCEVIDMAALDEVPCSHWESTPGQDKDFDLDQDRNVVHRWTKAWRNAGYYLRY